MQVIVRNCIVKAALCTQEVGIYLVELWSYIQRTHKKSADCKASSDKGELITG